MKANTKKVKKPPEVPQGDREGHARRVQAWRRTAGAQPATGQADGVATTSGPTSQGTGRGEGRFASPANARAFYASRRHQRRQSVSCPPTSRPMIWSNSCSVRQMLGLEVKTDMLAPKVRDVVERK